MRPIKLILLVSVKLLLLLFLGIMPPIVASQSMNGMNLSSDTSSSGGKAVCQTSKQCS
jgi:hypothetical protein